ncbi:MAG TPA: hypothetical protein VG694_02590 [Candidatus Paceibacterota bacterium]|nr:hypothetical protein [Candidatus Paceibacterota bacterium]
MEIPQLSIQISASTVAWYGAIVATLGAGVSLFNAWKDRPRIKIKYEPDQYMIGNPLIYPEDKKYLCINVINKGRRPIKIEQASIRQYGTSGYLVLPDSFRTHRPQIIDEKVPRTTFATSQDQFQMDKIYCVIVTDGTGKKYKKYVKVFPTFEGWLRKIRNHAK